MNLSAQIEREPAEHLLTRLNAAIDEAKHARSTIVCGKLAQRESVSRRLKLINREIELLEAKRTKVCCQTNSNRKISFLLRLKFQALINSGYSRVFNDYILRCSHNLKYRYKLFL